jgi:hypothetical protein
MTIPLDVIRILEAEIDGVTHGTVSLTIHLRDNHTRFVIGRERSFLPETLVKGMDTNKPRAVTAYDYKKQA